jgi:hypothetical protein
MLATQLCDTDTNKPTSTDHVLKHRPGTQFTCSRDAATLNRCRRIYFVEFGNCSLMLDMNIQPSTLYLVNHFLITFDPEEKNRSSVFRLASLMRIVKSTDSTPQVSSFLRCVLFVRA